MRRCRQDHGGKGDPGAALGDRIGIIRQGKLTWEGRPGELAEDEAGLVDALSGRLEGEGDSFEAV